MKEKIKGYLKISIVFAFVLTCMIPMPVSLHAAEEGEVAQAVLYPKPQSMEHLSNEGMTFEGSVNLVIHGTQKDATITKIKALLESKQISYEESNEIKEDKANIFITSDWEHCEECNQDIGGNSAALNEAQGYLIKSTNDTNTKGVVSIIGADEDGAYYGVVSLMQIMEQATSDGRFAEILIADYPSVKLRGFVEGFYGFPWTFEQRVSLMQESSKFKMNTYIYAPKDDPYHKDRWKELYPAEKAEELRLLAEAGKQDNLNFCWSVHPGKGFNYANDTDFNLLIAKFEQLYDLGVRQFGISYDDLEGTASGINHANLINRVNQEFVKQKGDVKPLIVVGTRYCNGWGPSMTTYFKPFFSTLEEDVVVMWTGANTMAPVAKADYEWPKTQTGVNKNLAAWWNYPVNDYADGNLMMSPLENLDTDVDNLTGFFLNPMSQAEASKVAIFSGADYAWNISAFERTSSWMRAIDELVPEASASFQRFADNVSFIKDGFEFDESRYLVGPIDAFVSALQNGVDIKIAASQLKTEFMTMKQDVTLLRNIGNKGLLSEITQHLNAYEALADAGISSMDAFITAEDGDIAGCLKNIGTLEAKLAEAETYKIDSLEANGVKQNVVKVGEKRIKPLLKDSISQIKQQLANNVFPAMEPYVIGNMSGFSEYRVEMQKGNYILSDIKGNIKKDETFGMALPKAMKVSSVVLKAKDVDNLELQYSLNGIDWVAISSTKKDGELQAEINEAVAYVRVVATETKKSIEIDEFSVHPVYSTGKMVAITDLGTYGNNKIENAIDGKMNTKFYSSAGAKVGSYIRVDLGKAIPLHDISIYYAGNPKGPEHGVDGFAATSLEVSKDGVNWVKIGANIPYQNYVQKTIEGQLVSSADYNADGEIANYIRFSATESSDNWVQVYEVAFNQSEGILGDDKIDLVTTTFESGDTTNLYDRDLMSTFAPNEVKANDTLILPMTTITNVESIMLLQDATTPCNAKVSVKNLKGEWREIGLLDQEFNTLVVNERILEMKLTFDGLNPTPNIYEVIISKRDTSELDSIILKAEKLIDDEKEDVMTTSTWNMFEKAYEAAKNLSEQATAEEMKAAALSLEFAIAGLENRASDVAIESLTKLLTSCKMLETEFTEAEFKDMKVVISEVEVLLSKGHADISSQEVTTALTDLFAAKEALKITEGSALMKNLILHVEIAEEVLSQDLSHIRPAQITALKAAVKEAKILINENSKDEVAIRASIIKLAEKQQALWEIINKTELLSLIAIGEKYPAEPYTDASWNNLVAALKVANIVSVNGDATEQEVTTAYTELFDAIAGLEKVVVLNKDVLISEITAVEKIMNNKDKYIPSSIKELPKALENAKVSLEKATTQKEVDDATKTLVKAKLKARQKPDTKVLTRMLIEAKSLDVRGYSKQSVKVLKTAITETETVLGNEEATEKEVKGMEVSLQFAMDAFTKANPSIAVGVSGNKPAVRSGDETNTTPLLALLTLSGAILYRIQGRRKDKRRMEKL